MARAPRSAVSKAADGNWCTTRTLRNWIAPRVATEIATERRSMRITRWDSWPGASPTAEGTAPSGDNRAPVTTPSPAADTPTSTTPSTTIPGSPTPKSWTTSAKRQLPPSGSEPAPSTDAWRGNAESTGRPWTESTGTVRRHDEGSIRRPRPARRAAVCLRGSAVRWSGWCSCWWRGELRLEGLDQGGGPLFRALPREEAGAVGVGGDVDVVVPSGAVACQKRLDALFRAVD